MAFTEFRRLTDTKPIVAHLYVTDQCNLDCHYCNEYDNSVPHPPISELKKWIEKIYELGAVRLGLQGGEPLLHPDIVELVRYAKELGFNKVSMSTNGFPLDQELVNALDNAGLDSCQISVDRMTPISSTRKSFKSVAHKLDLFKGTNIKVNVSGVLFEDTLDEMNDVIDYSLSKGVPSHARIVHEDLLHGEGKKLPEKKSRYLQFINNLATRKKQGEKIHTSCSILDYQKDLLLDQTKDWTCIAGYKYFFVSAKGEFWLCSQVRGRKSIMKITPDDLLAYNQKKKCQSRCGVYCIIATSLLINNPTKFLAKEALHRLGCRWRGFWRNLFRVKPSPHTLPSITTETHDKAA